MTTVTRAMVLEAATGLRAGEPTSTAEQRLDRLVRDIIAGAVPVGGDLVDYTAYPTSGDAAVTGVLLDVSLTRTDSVATRSVATVLLAPTADEARLDGSLIVLGLPVDAADGDGARTLHTSSLTGDVHVSAPVDVADSGVLRVSLTSATAPPPTSATAPAPATPTKRTPAELAAARATYDAALRAARTKYAKARKKAGRSKRKRVAAKKAYDTRRARAKAAYRAATADVPARPTPPVTAPAPATPDLGDASTIIATDIGWAPVV